MARTAQGERTEVALASPAALLGNMAGFLFIAVAFLAAFFTATSAAHSYAMSAP
jgi:hypothetical protein